MRLNESQLRHVVRTVLSEGKIQPAIQALQQQFPFIKSDALELLSWFVARFAADIATERSFILGQPKPTTEDVDELIGDVGPSMSAHVKDLTQHFIPQENKKSMPPPKRHAVKASPGTTAPTGTPPRPPARANHGGGTLPTGAAFSQRTG